MLKFPKFETNPFRQVWFILQKIGGLLWQTNKVALVVIIITQVIGSLLLLPGLYLDKLFIDTLVKYAGHSFWREGLQAILIIVIIRLIMGLVRDILLRLNNYLDNRLSREFDMYFDRIFASKYIELDVPTIENPEFRNKFDSILRQGGSRARRLVNIFGDLPQYLSGVVSVLILLTYSYPWIVLVSIGLLIPYMIVDYKFTRESYDLDVRLRTPRRIWDMVQYYLVRAKSYLELRILVIGKYLIQKMYGIQQEIAQAQDKLLKKQSIARFGVSLPVTFFSYALDIYFAILALIGQITIGSAQAYVRAISSFTNDLRNLLNTTIQFYQNYLYVSELVWFLELQPEKIGREVLLFPPKLKQGIIFKNVWFKYAESEKWILKDIDLQISSKENIAIVGANGVGKTTLVKLLAGFYSPTKGRITIDNISVQDLQRDSYWENLAMMPQDFEGYDFSVRESIGYGNVDKIQNIKAIEECSKLVGLDEWVQTLPLKYENPLSRFYEKGVTPSAGQWQKIGIARALIKDAQIIILDEPTSNVDPQAEEDIFNQILTLGKNKIIIFISHRFSTVRRADKIIVLDKGKILEQGSHDDLMKQNGKYAHLFNLQAKSYQ